MQELIFFIGPPADPDNDVESVTNFLNENGSKIILGGTTISIFERVTGEKALVNLETAAEGIPPYGSIGEITAAESSLTLKKVNEFFSSDYRFSNAVSLIKKEIESADRIKIYKGAAYNPVNGIDKESVVNEFIENIKHTGIKPEIVDY